MVFVEIKSSDSSVVSVDTNNSSARPDHEIIQLDIDISDPQIKNIMNSKYIDGEFVIDDDKIESIRRSEMQAEMLDNDINDVLEAICELAEDQIWYERNMAAAVCELYDLIDPGTSHDPDEAAAAFAQSRPLSCMAKIYFRRIIAGDISANDVPDRYKTAVQQLLVRYEEGLR